MRKLLPLLLLLLLAGCGKAVSVRENDLVVRGNGVEARPSPDQLSRGLRITSTRIAVVTHGQASDPIWAVVKRGIEDARRRENVGVSYEAPDTYDINRMRKMLEDAVSLHPDGIVVSLPDATVLGPAIRSAERAGIPVVTINSGSDKFLGLGVEAHVGQPELEAGVRAGERLAGAGVRHLLCVDHEPGNDGLTERCEGVERAMRSLGGTSTVLPVNLQDRMQAQRSIAQAIADGSIDGIVTLGPNGADEALAALNASGFQGKIKLATFDLSPEVLNAVQDGRILFAVDQQPYLEGYLPIVLLAERARHGLFPAAGGLIPTGSVAKACDRCAGGAREALEFAGRQLDLQSSPAAAHEHRAVPQGAVVDHGRQRLPLSQRADPARHVAGRALGVGDLRHLGTLAARGRGQRLEIELLLHRHDRDGQLAVDGRDERLVHALRVEVERGRRLQPVGLGLGVVLVGVRADLNAGPLQRLRRRCALRAHVRCERTAPAPRSHARSPSCGSTAGPGAGPA